MPVPQRSRSGHLRRHPGRLVVLAVSAVAALLVTGCSEPEPDPVEVRAEVVRNRLGETFSEAQVDCIMGRLDDSVLQALDRDIDLDPDGEAMAAYSEAVSSCVADPAATPADEENPPDPENSPADDDPPAVEPPGDDGDA